MTDIPNTRNQATKYVNKRLFLVGMPGAGKTYWGTQLAGALNLPFVDMDDYISLKEKASIPALFASYGEKGFREREQRYLTEIIGRADTPLVMACGGGTPCFFNNMDLMKKSGVVVYLEVPIPELVERLNKSTDVRPLLKGRGDPGVFLGKMLKDRRVVYEQAHHILRNEFISIANFEKILTYV